MKVSDRQKSFLRMCLWVGGVAWSVYFFIYGLIMLPTLKDTTTALWGTNDFRVWITMVGAVLLLIVPVVIFFWFFTQLWERK